MCGVCGICVCNVCVCAANDCLLDLKSNGVRRFDVRGDGLTTIHNSGLLVELGGASITGGAKVCVCVCVCACVCVCVCMRACMCVCMYA